ncbi:tail protein X [Labrys portucalensis]|uniref:Tail protein X n=1 Tax=Labrys neptuniae TaxID=376174 RepID=A0ABV6ZK30_9HYPH
MAKETLTVSAQYTPLDLLIWRRFRDGSAGMVEVAFDGNAGLADAGPFLPVGTEVQVDLPEVRRNKPRPLVRLWD